MKNIVIILNGLVVLMLMSFTLPQEKKVVRLKNGNYIVNKFKMEREDAQALQKQIDEMAKTFYEDFKGEKGKKDKEKPKYEDFLTIYQSAEGFKDMAAFGAEENHYAFKDEISENTIKQSFYFKFESKDDKKKKEEFRAQIDKIMGKYL